MRATSTTYATDKQRFSRSRAVCRLPVVGDKTFINHVARVPKAPAGLPVTPKPLVVSEKTFVIRGKDGTYLGIAFGDGRQAQEVNLYDHLPADRVPVLGNYVLSLTGIIPDAIGIDIGAAAGVGLSLGTTIGFTPLMGGINLIWHTRGEGNRWMYPELHVYHGMSAETDAKSPLSAMSKGSINVTASAAVQVVLAWARTYDAEGRYSPASDAWVANGYNWTGTFLSYGFSIPIPPYTLVGSLYQSASVDQWVPFGENLRSTTVWRGVSVGVGVGVSGSRKIIGGKLDITKILNWKDYAGSYAKTNYGLVYGNGNDFIPATHIPALQVRADQHIDGWHMPVNQDDYYNDPRSQNNNNAGPRQD